MLSRRNAIIYICTGILLVPIAVLSGFITMSFFFPLAFFGMLSLAAWKVALAIAAPGTILVLPIAAMARDRGIFTERMYRIFLGNCGCVIVALNLIISSSGKSNLTPYDPNDFYFSFFIFFAFSAAGFLSGYFAAFMHSWISENIDECINRLTHQN